MGVACTVHRALSLRKKDVRGVWWVESVRAIWPTLINCLFVFVTGENWKLLVCCNIYTHTHTVTLTWRLKKFQDAWKLFNEIIYLDAGNLMLLRLIRRSTDIYIINTRGPARPQQISLPNLVYFHFQHRTFSALLLHSSINCFYIYEPNLFASQFLLSLDFYNLKLLLSRLRVVLQLSSVVKFLNDLNYQSLKCKAKKIYEENYRWAH